MKTFLLALAGIFCLSAIVQSTPTDTLIWKDGTIYYGKLEKKGHSGVNFRTKDGELYYAEKSSISEVRLADGSGDALKQVDPRDTIGQAKAMARKMARRAEVDSLTQVYDELYPSVNWSDPTIPRYIMRKHRTGIGLSVTGSVLIAGGIGMVAGGLVQNGQTRTVSNGYSTQTTVNIGGLGLGGILSIVAGLPMVIVGGIQATKARRLALAHQGH